MNIWELLEGVNLRKLDKKYYNFKLEGHDDMILDKKQMVEYGTYLTTLAAEILESAQDLKDEDE